MSWLFSYENSPYQIPAGPNLLTHIILLIELCMFFIALCYKIIAKCWDFVGEQYKLWRGGCYSRTEWKVVPNHYIATTTIVIRMLLSWLTERNTKKNIAIKEKNRGFCFTLNLKKSTSPYISYFLKSHRVQKKFQPNIPELHYFWTDAELNRVSKRHLGNKAEI